MLQWKTIALFKIKVRIFQRLELKLLLLIENNKVSSLTTISKIILVNIVRKNIYNNDRLQTIVQMNYFATIQRLSPKLTSLELLEVHLNSVRHLDPNDLWILWKKFEHIAYYYRNIAFLRYFLPKCRGSSQEHHKNWFLIFRLETLHRERHQRE